MTVDIRGISPVNRGAQLMMRAIVARLGEEFELSSNPWQGDYGTRARLGLGQTLHHYRFRRMSVHAGNRMPGKVATKFGLVRDRDISAVLDASGFAYSDSFSLDRHQREAYFGRRWSSRGVPKVVLPQAFGPFRDGDKAALTREILNQAEIVFARDDVSARHLDKLGIRTEVVRSVDFTIGLAATDVPRPFSEPFAAIVPNTKLVTSGLIGSRDYVDLLAAYAKAIRAQGLAVLIVVHEDSDRALALELQRRDGSAGLFEHEDPLVLKGVLGMADLVVASRYHAVVGALSQGVRTIALGWSHKYEELMNDFGVPNWMATFEAPAVNTLARVHNDDAGAVVIRERKAELMSRVDEMWARTELAIR